MVMKTSICDMTPEQFRAELEEKGVPGFRAKQIYQWAFGKGAADFGQMKNLPEKLQQLLQENYTINPLKMIVTQVSQVDHTTKVLYELADGETIETVMMYYGSITNPERITVCVSTQVGCAMGCSFCATGLGGFKRNLTSGEIIGQILGLQQMLKKKNPELRVGNVVYMGMGEPLLNYDNLIDSIRMLNHQEIFNISYRRITISTCGIVPQIKRLAAEKLPVVLAISLHGATDEIRTKIMPVNIKYPLNTLLEACQDYIEATGRKITLEYILLEGVNDSDADARHLANLIRGMLVNVNIIPYNQVSETGHMRSNTKKVKLFANLLAKLGIESVVREEKGGDISAACGQLRQAKRGTRGGL